MAITNTTSHVIINTPDSAFVLNATKPGVFVLTMNTGADGSVTLGKAGLYYLTVNNAHATATATFDFDIDSTAATTPPLRILVLPDQAVSFYFKTTAASAVLHGIQSSGANTTASASLVEA